MLRPLLGALHRFPREGVVAVLDSTIPRWWEKPFVRTLADRWVEGLKGDYWEDYAALLAAVRDARGLARVLGDLRDRPYLVKYRLRPLTFILERAAEQTPEEGLLAVLALNDEYVTDEREQDGWTGEDNQEVPYYREWKETHDFRPLKRLAAAELARRNAKTRG